MTELKGSADARKGTRDRQRQRKGETEHLSVTWVPMFILRSEGAEGGGARGTGCKEIVHEALLQMGPWSPGVLEELRPELGGNLAQSLERVLPE